MSNYDDSETRFRRTTIRKVRRLEEPRTPFMPWGLLPLLGLLALTSFSCTRIQEKTEAAVERALTDADLDWANAEARGRDVYLKGTPPTEEAAKRAVRIAESAESKTLFGTTYDPTHVYDRFERPVAGAPTSGTLNRPSAPPTGINGLSPDWSFRLFDGVLKLEGEVPDEDTRLDIISSAQRLAPTEDNLSVRGAAAPEGYEAVAQRGIDIIRECDRGVVSFRSEVFTVDCDLSGSDEARVRAMASAALPIGRVGTINLTGGSLPPLNETTISICETSLSALLSNTQIKFASDKADIDPSSQSLIDSIAEATKSCPGTLRIEGHTDITGRAEYNDLLSLMRAEAVRTALVDKDVSAIRLVARGFGAKNPIATNSTPDGRARNRRIEIKVVRPDE